VRACVCVYTRARAHVAEYVCVCCVCACIRIHRFVGGAVERWLPATKLNHIFVSHYAKQTSAPHFREPACLLLPLHTHTSMQVCVLLHTHTHGHTPKHHTICNNTLCTHDFEIFGSASRVDAEILNMKTAFVSLH